MMPVPDIKLVCIKLPDVPPRYAEPKSLVCSDCIFAGWQTVFLEIFQPAKGVLLPAVLPRSSVLVYSHFLI